MLSFGLISVVFLLSDLLLLMIIIVMKSSTISMIGMTIPRMIGVLSWSEKEIRL